MGGLWCGWTGPGPHMHWHPIGAGSAIRCSSSVAACFISLPCMLSRLLQASRLLGWGATVPKPRPQLWCRCRPTQPAARAACLFGPLGTAAAGCRQHGLRGRAGPGCSLQTCPQLACGTWRSWWRRTSGRVTSPWCRVGAGRAWLCRLLGRRLGLLLTSSSKHPGVGCSMGAWVPVSAPSSLPAHLPCIACSALPPRCSSLGQQLGVLRATRAALVCPRAH